MGVVTLARDASRRRGVRKQNELERTRILKMNLFKGIAVVCHGGRRGRNLNENYVCARTSTANGDSRDSLIFRVKMEARFPFASGIGISYFEQWSPNKLLKIL